MEANIFSTRQFKVSTLPVIIIQSTHIYLGKKESHKSVKWIGIHLEMEHSLDKKLKQHLTRDSRILSKTSTTEIKCTNLLYLRLLCFRISASTVCVGLARTQAQRRKRFSLLQKHPGSSRISKIQLRMAFPSPLASPGYGKFAIQAEAPIRCAILLIKFYICL